jgi:trk system potassium uptake protein TrkA
MAQHHTVRVVEHRTSVLNRLHRDLPTEMIFEGLPIDPTVLELAGARRADVVATTLTSDEDNLVICYMAHTLFDVKRTIARINDPRHAWLFDEKFHVDVSLDNAAVMASMIQEEMSLGDMMTLLRLRSGEYSLVEEKIPPGAPIIGKALQDLGLVESCVIAAIIRDGKVVVPRGSSIFQIGDEVLAIADLAGADQLHKMISPEVIV